MGVQLNIFQEQKKSNYQKYYEKFYKGVKERYAKERVEASVKKFTPISIRINLKK